MSMDKTYETVHLMNPSKFVDIRVIVAAGSAGLKIIVFGMHDFDCTVVSGYQRVPRRVRLWHGTNGENSLLFESDSFHWKGRHRIHWKCEAVWLWQESRQGESDSREDGERGVEQKGAFEAPDGSLSTLKVIKMVKKSLLVSFARGVTGGLFVGKRIVQKFERHFFG
jgi:hypothetical protein